jgi:hypothetical protein
VREQDDTAGPGRPGQVGVQADPVHGNSHVLIDEHDWSWSSRSTAARAGARTQTG